MNPQLFQSIQLMAMPIQELKFKIQEELEKNPALEMIEDKSEISLEELKEKPTEEFEYFENSSDPGYPRSYNDEASDSKRKFMEGAIARPESLQDHLLWQLRLQPVPKQWFTIGELLIQNLDAEGFHRTPPETLVNPADLDVLPEVLNLIQSFEPMGTCTRDYIESLIIQARLSPNTPDRTIELLENHFKLLEKNKKAEIVKKMKLDDSELQKILTFIKTLNPFPGRKFSIEDTTYVVPDLMVRMKEGEFVLILNDEEIPVLGVNSFYTSMLHEKKREADLKSFVRTNLKNARWFIRSIHQRNETLLKIARAIIEFQRDFFMKGPKHLIPLTLKDIAGEVGVHETTVSRISNAKYIQTEWGIYELKYFFTNSISGAGSTGSRFSKQGVKEIIREIIQEEEGRSLSDQKISGILKERGISLARRTVSKYRRELDIDSSYLR